jgi:helix-turn-helix protein
VSPKLRNYVADHSKLKGCPKSVLLEIAALSNDSGEGAYASVRTLARRIGRSPRTVQRALDQARQADELAIYYNRGPHGTNHYRVRLENLRSEVQARQHVTGDKLTHKGSSLRESQYSSSLSPAGGLERSKQSRLNTGARHRRAILIGDALIAVVMIATSG